MFWFLRFIIKSVRVHEILMTSESWALALCNLFYFNLMAQLLVSWFCFIITNLNCWLFIFGYAISWFSRLIFTRALYIGIINFHTLLLSISAKNDIDVVSCFCRLKHFLGTWENQDIIKLLLQVLKERFLRWFNSIIN